MRNNGGPPMDDAPKMRVIRIHINDWVASTRGMSLDEEGFYWRITCLFYDRMGDLPDDDAMVARAMSLDIRRYRKMKEMLIERGHIKIVGGRISNRRAEHEIEMYVAEFKRRSEAAQQREDRRRIDRQKAAAEGVSAELQQDFARTSTPKSSRLRPDFDPEVQQTSPGLRSQLTVDLSRKPSENNERTATTVTTTGPQPSRARAFPKPKPISNTPLSPPEGGGPPSPVDQAFEEFWLAFPPGRKQDKGGARDAFRKIVTGKHRKKLRAKASDLVDAARRYADTRPEPEFTPMPTTWLNGGRWEDDLAESSATPSPVEGKSWGWWRGKEDALRGYPVERWDRAIISAKPNGTWPWWLLGAPPGHPECLVPEELVERYGYAEIYRGSIHHA